MALTRKTRAGLWTAVFLSLPTALTAGVAVAALPQAKTSGSEEAQLLFWSSIKDSKDPAEFQAYLDQYPNGVFAKLAEIKLAKLKQVPAPQASPAVAQVKPKPATTLPTPVPNYQPVAPSPQLQYRVSVRGGRAQPLTLRYDGKAWVSVESYIDRHNCLLGGITDISQGSGVFDAQRLLDEATSGVGEKTYKRKVFSAGGNEAPTWYKYTRLEEDGALVRLAIEGDEQAVSSRSNQKDPIRMSLSVTIDRQRGIVTSAKSQMTNSVGTRYSCDVVLAD
ncbi:hypothetical protein [Jeongeupia naejangsanensis]|uniref:Uncharacterized protein n=1 Tax=Jeongeupia naejangsanensis TaxID=613195 RepID=A0ABS2BJ04_9NEIS|nr:hypothetical protein [Jeongeupia naejangsanensis]MBM3115593.1 hypothetical protein [Jeongeupia naejangsanensis]